MFSNRSAVVLLGHTSASARDWAEVGHERRAGDVGRGQRQQRAGGRGASCPGASPAASDLRTFPKKWSAPATRTRDACVVRCSAMEPKLRSSTGASKTVRELLIATRDRSRLGAVAAESGA